MRTSVIAVSILMLLSVAAFGQSSSETALLQSGIAAYREGNMAGAVEDLQAATQSFLSPQRMQAYVNTGKFQGLADFERALIYLALAQSRLGRESDARETMVRLMTAERIEPTYANIPLESDAAEFETLFARVMPEARLPRNIQLAGGNAPAPAPVAIAEATTPEPETALPAVTAAPETALPAVTAAPTTTVAEAPQTSSGQAPSIPQQSPTAEPAAPVATAQAQDKLVVQPTLASEREERQRIIDELVARERERIQREADARIAEIQRTNEQRLAEARRQAESQIAQLRQETTTQVTAARTEAERVAEERLAEERRQAEQQVARARQEAETARVEAERLAQQRIAEANRVAEQRIVEEREAAARAVREQLAAADANARRAILSSLRQAEAFASNERISEANELYRRVVNSENVPREYLTEAAVGLYRTGAFRDSVAAFRRLGTFAKGEEDLRYYHAVALYETGNYEAAKKELACALPFIQVTDDVTRYQAKIDQTSAQRASR